MQAASQVVVGGVIAPVQAGDVGLAVQAATLAATQLASQVEVVGATQAVPFQNIGATQVTGACVAATQAVPFQNMGGAQVTTAGIVHAAPFQTIGAMQLPTDEVMQEIPFHTSGGAQLAAVAARHEVPFHTMGATQLPAIGAMHEIPFQTIGAIQLLFAGVVQDAGLLIQAATLDATQAASQVTVAHNAGFAVQAAT